LTTNINHDPYHPQEREGIKTPSRPRYENQHAFEMHQRWAKAFFYCFVNDIYMASVYSVLCISSLHVFHLFLFCSLSSIDTPFQLALVRFLSFNNLYFFTLCILSY